MVRADRDWSLGWDVGVGYNRDSYERKDPRYLYSTHHRLLSWYSDARPSAFAVTYEKGADVVVTSRDRVCSTV